MLLALQQIDGGVKFGPMLIRHGNSAGLDKPNETQKSCFQKGWQTRNLLQGHRRASNWFNILPNIPLVRAVLDVVAQGLKHAAGRRDVSTVKHLQQRNSKSDRASESDGITASGRLRLVRNSGIF